MVAEGKERIKVKGQRKKEKDFISATDTHGHAENRG